MPAAVVASTPTPPAEVGSPPKKQRTEESWVAAANAAIAVAPAAAPHEDDAVLTHAASALEAVDDAEAAALGRTASFRLERELAESLAAVSQKSMQWNTN